MASSARSRDMKDHAPERQAAPRGRRRGERPGVASATALWRTSARRLRVAIGRRLRRDPTWRTGPVIGLAAVGAAALVAIGVASVVGALGGRGFTPIPASPAATGQPSDEPAGTEGSNAAEAAIEETFDALPMDSSLAPPWVVSGEGASIVALPTSVDRSVRIRTSTGGEASSACRAVGPTTETEIRIGFDVLLGGRSSATAPLLRLERADSPLLTIGVDPSGALVQIEPQPAASGTGAPTAADDSDEWRRVEVQVDSSQSSVAWLAHDDSGAQVAAGTSRIERGSTMDELCLLSPAGAPSSWIAIDDLIVQG